MQKPARYFYEVLCFVAGTSFLDIPQTSILVKGIRLLRKELKKMRRDIKYLSSAWFS